MKLQNTFLTLLILFVSFQFCLGQEIDFEGNWFREIKGYDDYYTSYDFRFYTKDDVVKAKKRINLIKQSPLKGDWEGIYTISTGLGRAELYLSYADGFVYYYVYHSLASLDFGKTLDEKDYVKLLTEKVPISKRLPRFSGNFVKVKFGDKHFLVPENRLQDFSNRAVGLSIDLTGDNYYWQKVDESEDKVFGLPILPKKYRRFLRFPINTEIIRIGNRQLHQNKFEDGTVYSEEIYRFITFGAGKNKKIKVGMNFFVEDLDEWIEITKVLPNSSIGKITRYLNENKQEQCGESEKDQGETVTCKEIKVGMKAKTKVSESFF